MAILLKNPHSILAALVHRPEAVVEIEFPREKNLNEVWQEIESRFSNIDVVADSPNFQRSKNSKNSRNSQRSNKRVPKSGTFHDTERGNSAYAVIREKPPLAMEKLLNPINENGEKISNGVWLALDCLQDPQNVGALFRTAAFLGVKGVLLTSERSSPLTSVVYDISAGGVEQLPYAMVTNLVHVLQYAKKQEIWVLGTSEHATDNLSDVKLDRNWLVMMGNEEKGLRRLTIENCDMLVGIPPMHTDPGMVTSLNVSVAAGMALYQLLGKN